MKYAASGADWFRQFSNAELLERGSFDFAPGNLRSTGPIDAVSLTLLTMQAHHLKRKQMICRPMRH